MKEKEWRIRQYEKASKKLWKWKEENKISEASFDVIHSALIGYSQLIKKYFKNIETLGLDKIKTK